MGQKIRESLGEIFLELDWKRSVFAGLYSRTSDIEILDGFIPDLTADYPVYSEQGKTMNWQFKSEDSRIKLKQLFPKLSL